MSTSIAIIGPGRLGQALARLWCDAGHDLLGFLGRDAARAAAAVAFAGHGRPLVPDDLPAAGVVVVTVPDRALAETVERLAVHTVAGSLWLHSSGVHGLEPLAPLARRGAEIAAMHPLAPVPDPLAGLTTLPGRPALIEAAAEVVQDVVDLARDAGLEPIVATAAVDRARYHAACALAANGTTALGSVAARLIAGAAGLPAELADRVVGQLCAAAGRLVAERGAAEALSGPLLRGDVDVLAAHLEALRREATGDAADLYRDLTRSALPLAAARGGDARMLERVRRLLDGERLD